MSQIHHQEFSQSDLIVFSHLRWDFVFQRPQHLMTRFSKSRRVFFIEEPVTGDYEASHLLSRKRNPNIVVVTPHLPHGLNAEHAKEEQKKLLDDLILSEKIEDFDLWYYNPLALSFTEHLDSRVIIYDCMDELARLHETQPDSLSIEKDLIRRADLVFTGGQALYEAKQHLHPHVHCFPSSIDTVHFKQARHKQTEPEDQAKIEGTKVGFLGVIDERFDISLLEESAKIRPDWQFILIGPIVKIDPTLLPNQPNIHYLGRRDYQEVPAYLSHWDLAILPFVKNESTRFLSPNRTEEYLAAGLPVVSTSLTDVIHPYGDLGLVQIADGAEAFVEAGEVTMTRSKIDETWLYKVDRYLGDKSWDETARQMQALELDLHERHKRVKEEGTVVPNFLLPKKSSHASTYKT